MRVVGQRGHEGEVALLAGHRAVDQGGECRVRGWFEGRHCGGGPAVLHEGVGDREVGGLEAEAQRVVVHLEGEAVELLPGEELHEGGGERGQQREVVVRKLQLQRRRPLAQRVGHQRVLQRFKRRRVSTADSTRADCAVECWV